MKSLYHMKRYARGVTLLELLLVIAIVGIAASIAMPHYRRMISLNKVSSVVSDLHSSLLLARSEALKRGVPVGVCKSSSINSTSPMCDASAAPVGWGTGWIIFEDTDRSGVKSATEPVIQVKGPYFSDAAEGRVISSIASNLILFNVTGQTFGNAQFTVYSPTGISGLERSVCVAIGGRAKVVDGTAC